MRLASYEHRDSGPRPGLILGEERNLWVVDLVEEIGVQAGPNGLLPLLDLASTAASRSRDAWRRRPQGVPLDEVTLLPPLRRPGKIIAAAGNYDAHVAEGGGPPLDKSRRAPNLFLKPSSAIVGPGAWITLPETSQTVDWELELAVVIGRNGKGLTPGSARSHIAGYTIFNDISARSMDWGIEDREVHEMDAFFDWLAGKWPDGFAAMGPWITTPDEVDPMSLEMSLSVNDVVRQHGYAHEMIFSPEELVAFASRFMTLEIGDVVACGTLGGVGSTSATYLRPGDVMRGAISGLGRLDTGVSGGRDDG